MVNFQLMNGMFQIRSEIDNCHKSIGLSKLFMSKNEKSLIFKRSIYVKENIKKKKLSQKITTVVRLYIVLSQNFMRHCSAKNQNFPHNRGDRPDEKNYRKL